MQPIVLASRRRRLAVIAAASLSLAVSLAASGGNVAVTGDASPVLRQQDVPIFAIDAEYASVFIELEGLSAADAFVAERDGIIARNAGAAPSGDSVAQAERAAASAAFNAAQDLLSQQQPLMRRLVDEFDARVLFNSRFASNGVGVRIPTSAIAAIRALPGVKSVSPLVEHEVDAASSLDFTGVRSFWGQVAPDLGLRGANIGVGVIDSGIDHMHRAFGGPGGTNYKLGVTAATPYPAPPAVPTASSFPTPKVVWGFDFVGDTYRADGTTDAQLIPVPDLNPMDGGTHGTSVASLISGLGVNADGSTYAGPYNRNLPAVESPSIRISPGYAPESPLYAFRVFGNAGSSAVVSAALDAATAIYLWQSDTSIPWDGQVTATVFNQAGQPQLVTYNLPQPPTSPRLRVVNLSLGSNAGDIEESSAQAAQRAADAGLIVVLSAGNAADTYYITGAPGVASGGISVAASINNQVAGAVANAPANGAQPALAPLNITQLTSAGFSTAAQSLPATDVVYARPNLAEYSAPAPVGFTPTDPGQLVTLRDPNGVDINLFSVSEGQLVVTLNPAADNIYAGKVVLVDRGVVGFHQKGLAAARAGAAAVVVVNSAAALGGMAANPLLPSISIPSGMIAQATGAQLGDGGALNTGVARTIAARPGLTLQMLPTTAANQDTMAIYSSRGPRRNDDGIKPDISAPAEVVTVANSGSGDGVSGFNGTSSAAPHTAGAMTLLRQLNPTWTNFELKALLLNSTAQDVFVNPGASLVTAPTGIQWGVSRQGAGRWDLSAFAGGGTKVIMFGEDPLPTAAGASRRGNVNVSYGVVDVTGTAQVDRNVTIRNKGLTAQTFSIGFREVAATPGVSFSFPDGNLITVPAQSERSIRVRMSADATQMRHAREPGLRPFQFINATTRFPRQFINEAAGYVTLTPSGGSTPTHRLTVQAFPRRASDVSVAGQSVTIGQQASIALQGTGFNTGPNTAFANPPAFDNLPTVVDVVSFAKPLELSFVSAAPQTGVTPMQGAGDIQYVGVTTDFPNRAEPFGASPAVVQFGVAVRGEFDTPQSGFGTEFFIEIDLNNDQTTDRAVRQFAFTNAENAPSTSNILLPVVSTAAPFNSGSSTGWALNVFSTQYSNLYNNSVLTIPVSIAGAGATLGLTAGNTRFNYRVTGIHRGVAISSTPWLSYDVAAPGVSFPGVQEPSMFPSVDGQGQATTISVQTNAANIGANGTQGILMLYPMNARGDRAEVVPLVLPDAIFGNGFEE